MTAGGQQTVGLMLRMLLSIVLLTSTAPLASSKDSGATGSRPDILLTVIDDLGWNE